MRVQRLENERKKKEEEDKKAAEELKKKKEEEKLKKAEEKKKGIVFTKLVVRFGLEDIGEDVNALKLVF